MVKLLIVEDNEVERELLSRRFRRKGYEVLTASDGKAGVEMAFTEAPHLILMDLSMPILDGWEATRQIKARDDPSHIPVIALTAHAMKGDRAKAIDAGCDDYDTKPINLARLLSKILALLETSENQSNG